MQLTIDIGHRFLQKFAVHTSSQTRVMMTLQRESSTRVLKHPTPDSTPLEESGTIGFKTSAALPF